jgi:hypothetical protein
VSPEVESPEYKGPERRQPPFGGRVVYSRGPIVKWLERGTFASSLMGLVAIVVAGYLFVNRTDQIQQSRGDSAADTCRILRELILATATQPPRPIMLQFAGGRIERAKLTNVGQAAIARSTVTRYGLNDCVAYGQRITKLK